MKPLDDFVKCIVNESAGRGTTYYYLVLGTSNSLTSAYFRVIGNEVSYDGQETIYLFDKFRREIEDRMLGQGMLCIKVEDGQLIEHSILTDLNPELYDSDLFELTLYQQYRLEPADAERKEVLQQSLQAEKIKETLVFACYRNDMSRIEELVPTARKSELDKVLAYAGTALQFCARHNNLEAFRLLAEKGANVGKSALSQTPLQIAFQYSSDIVNYIHSEYTDIYNKEVKKKGFGIALHCHDLTLLQNILALGCDVNGDKKPFPPLHSFADYNNAAGIKFLLQHGANMECRNQYNQTALHRAVRGGNKDAAAALLEYGADIYAKDRNGTTPLESARTREDKAIWHMMASRQA